MRRAAKRSSIAAFIAASTASLAAIGMVRAEIVREAAEPILRLDLPGHTSEVRVLAFFPGSSRLVSGGRDKVAMVWNPDARRVEAAGPLTRDIGRRRTRERVLRWQAARGTRGAIQAVAVSAHERPIVAIGGSGAMGSTGEVLLFDGRDGTLLAVLGGGEKPGHRNSVLAVDFSIGGDWLFSQDFDGQAFAWKKDDGWRPIELAAREDLRYGPVRTAAVQARPRMRPLAAITGGRVALPVLVSPEGAAKEVWRIELVDPTAPAARRFLPTDHLGVVMAMDASPDGRFLASADLAGRVHVHDLGAEGSKPSSFRVTPAVESIAVSPDGATIAVGVAAGAAGASVPRMELWNAGTDKRIFTREMPSPVRAVAISDDGKLACWSGGWRHEIFVEPIASLVADAEVRGRLGGVGRRIGRVTFERQEDGRAAPRRIAVSWDPPPGAGTGVAAAFDAAFDLESLALADPPAAERLAPPDGLRKTWTIARAAKQPAGIEVWQILREGRPAGRIDLDIDWQGRMGAGERCVAWLDAAVAIGTDRGIFVYSLDGTGNTDEPRPIVRRYRGHEDGVTAICVSEDGRWLASGGRDGIVMIWPISGLDGGPLFERFGIGLEVGTGRAVVSRVDEAGPLAGRDVAVGDVLSKVSAAAEGPDRPAVEAVAGDAVATALTKSEWTSQWSFVVERDGKADEPFHRQPAWENVAAFHLADNREWAYWTPRGYYAASANGDGLFGWLVNRGLDRLPRFHPARQFRRRLERPDVMSRLLTEGSLAAALKRVGRDLPDSSARLLPRLIASSPDVRILSPEAFGAAGDGPLRVRATIEVPAGVELADVRAYASGVAARRPASILEDRPLGEGRAARTYEWDIDLPTESRHLVQVFAGTSEGTTDVGETIVSRSAAIPTRRRPRLHLLAAGVDRYRHADRYAADGLSNLVFAAADAEAVHTSLARRGTRLFGGLASGVLLRDEQVTREAWKSSLATIAETIAADVTPDDIVVLFLAGHGMIDTARRAGYSYLCHDATFDDVGGEPAPSESTTIAWSDFQPLAALPCRKLALVDTCHAGGLAPAKRASAIRDFQENMMLVLAASADDETSQESDAWGHGAFTKVLLEALEGAADTRGASANADTADERGDGIVTVDEVVEHVIADVPRLTGDGGSGQHPTVSPDSLVPYVTLPLTRP